jgi:hypothetical protein
MNLSPIAISGSINASPLSSPRSTARSVSAISNANL